MRSSTRSAGSCCTNSAACHDAARRSQIGGLEFKVHARRPPPHRHAARDHAARRRTCAKDGGSGCRSCACSRPRSATWPLARAAVSARCSRSRLRRSAGRLLAVLCPAALFLPVARGHAARGRVARLPVHRRHVPRRHLLALPQHSPGRTGAVWITLFLMLGMVAIMGAYTAARRLCRGAMDADAAVAALAASRCRCCWVLCRMVPRLVPERLSLARARLQPAGDAAARRMRRWSACTA